MHEPVKHPLRRELGTRVWSIGSIVFLGLLLPRQCDYPPPGGGASGGGAATGGTAGATGGSANAGASSSTGGTSAFGGTSSTIAGASSIGGSSSDAGMAVIDPVMGCDAPEWPPSAQFEILPGSDGQPSPPSEAARARMYVSGDGRTVVGFSGDYVPTIWAEGRAAVAFGSETGYGAANCDGSVVLIGSSWWTSDGVLHPLQGGAGWFISNDGNYIVSFSGSEVLRWGPDRVPHQVLSTSDMLLEAISGDGQTLYGATNLPCQPLECEPQTERWNSATGLETLYPWGGYLVASSDGSTLASGARSSRANVVVWTETSGPRQFSCGQGETCAPAALSSRGHQLLVGFGWSSLIWSEKHGFRNLETVLNQFGASLHGYHLLATAMSHDGRVFAGGAWLDDVNASVPFRAVLPRAAWE